MEYICRVISALLLVAFLYSGWEARLSVAIYNAVWAIALWQVLEEICSMIELLGKDFFETYPFMIIVGMILLYIINHIWVAFTIGKWMPVDRGDTIGPRQLGSAILIFGIIEVLSMSPTLRNAAEHSFEWISFDRLKNEYFYPNFLKKEIFTLPDNFTIRTEIE